MCAICEIGERQIENGLKAITDVAIEAVTYPFSTTKTQKRVIRAAVELILASSECYGMELKEGMTEDEARKSYETLFAQAVEKKREALQSLMRVLGFDAKGDESIQDFIDKVRSKEGHEEVFDKMKDEEFIH